MRATTEIRLPKEAGSVRRMRGIGAAVLENLGAPPDVVDEVRLLISEACGNVIRHAGAGEAYRVVLTVGVGECVLEVRDDAPGGSGVPDAQAAMADPGDERGRGVALMRALVDRMEFTRTGDGLVLHLRKTWEPDVEEYATAEHEG